MKSPLKVLRQLSKLAAAVSAAFRHHMRQCPGQLQAFANSCSKWHRLHYQMWDWLSKHPTSDKSDWLAMHPEVKDLAKVNNCFACTRARELAKEKLSGQEVILCSCCPFDLQHKFLHDMHSNCLDGLWSRWDHSRFYGNQAAAAALAGQIRDFPLRRE